jgi:hypothetical protein
VPGFTKRREHRLKSVDADFTVHGDGVEGLVGLDEDQLPGARRTAVCDPSFLEPTSDLVPVASRGDGNDMLVRREPFADE